MVDLTRIERAYWLMITSVRLTLWVQIKSGGLLRNSFARRPDAPCRERPGERHQLANGPSVLPRRAEMGESHGPYVKNSITDEGSAFNL